MIYAWKWIWVLGTSLIQAGVVDAHLKLPVCLWNDDWCWGPSASEGPQKQDLTVFLEYNV
jgi:hypothetical protein